MMRSRALLLTACMAVIGAPLSLAGPAAGASAKSPSLTMTIRGPQRLDGRMVLLSRETLHVTALVRRAAPGSRLLLMFRHNGQVSTLQRSVGAATSAARVAKAAHQAIGPGVVTVTARLVGPDGKAVRHVSAFRRAMVLQPTAQRGSKGLHVRLLQRRLRQMRYANRVTGHYDDQTRRAVIAFRKVNRMRRVGNASRGVFFRAAHRRGAFHPRHRGARHVEADLTRQVLALVNRGGSVFKVYETSSGRPGLLTPAGTHRIWRKQAGWAHGQLHSAYFTSGCAIHGYFVVPTTNWSHCCLRVPIPDSWFIFTHVHIGERVYIYY